MDYSCVSVTARLLLLPISELNDGISIIVESHTTPFVSPGVQ